MESNCYKQLDINTGIFKKYHKYDHFVYNVLNDLDNEPRKTVISHLKKNENDIIFRIIDDSLQVLKGNTNENDIYQNDDYEPIIWETDLGDIKVTDINDINFIRNNIKYIFDCLNTYYASTLNDLYNIFYCVSATSDFKNDILEQIGSFCNWDDMNNKNLLVVKGGGKRIDQNIPKFVRVADFFIILIEGCDEGENWGCISDIICSKMINKNNKILHIKGFSSFLPFMSWDIIRYFNNHDKKKIFIDVSRYASTPEHYLTDLEELGDFYKLPNVHLFYSFGDYIAFYNQYDITYGNINKYVYHIEYIDYSNKCDELNIDDKKHFSVGLVCPLNGINMDELGTIHFLEKFKKKYVYYLRVLEDSMSGGYFSKYLKYLNKNKKIMLDLSQSNKLGIIRHN